jgi:hypothetical protein
MWGDGHYLFKSVFFGRILTALQRAPSPTSNQLQLVNRLFQGFGQHITLIATYIANNLLRQWNRVRIQLKCTIYKFHQHVHVFSSSVSGNPSSTSRTNLLHFLAHERETAFTTLYFLAVSVLR